MADKTVEVRFGGEQVGFLSITVRGRAYRNRHDYWDGNWLLVDVIVEISKFSAKVPGMLRAEELQRLSNEILTFYHSLTGIVSFTTMEGWLNFQIEADKLGSIKLSGVVSDNFQNVNSLTFVIETDQTFLNTPLKQLQIAVETFPIVGKPE